MTVRAEPAVPCGCDVHGDPLGCGATCYDRGCTDQDGRHLAAPEPWNPEQCYGGRPVGHRTSLPHTWGPPTDIGAQTCHRCDTVRTPTPATEADEPDGAA